MVYQVLARKWRPKKFEELIGQSNTVTALVNSLKENRLHHAYLFSGTRGIGKTTIARILAKCLNCNVGISDTPCEKCAICLDIDSGCFSDLIEVDAASRTKVEDTRELLDNVQYAPTVGRFKIYIIDEVHMLSLHSFNALLKTLEEPPLHAKFLLATTEPQKLPITVLSRCIQFNLRKMTNASISEHIACVLNKENIIYEKESLLQIAKAADGSIRDALSLTDQAIALGAGKITHAVTRDMLGVIDSKEVFLLLNDLANNQVDQILKRVHELSYYITDFTVIINEFLTILHAIAVYQATSNILCDHLYDNELLLSLAKDISSEDIQLYYQIAIVGKRDINLLPDSRQAFEMILLRMLAFRPNLPEKINRETKVESCKKYLSIDRTVLQDVNESLEKKNNQVDIKKDNLISKKLETENLMINQTAGLEIENKIDISQSLDKFHNTFWIKIFGNLPLDGMTKFLASNLSYTSHYDNLCVFKIDQSYKDKLNSKHQKKLEEVLSIFFGKKVLLKFEWVSKNTCKTPAEYLIEQEEEKYKNALSCIRQDLNVQNIVKRFSAHLDEKTVKYLI